MCESRISSVRLGGCNVGKLCDFLSPSLQMLPSSHQVLRLLQMDAQLATTRILSRLQGRQNISVCVCVCGGGGLADHQVHKA